MSTYNATVFRLDEQGNQVGVFVVEVDGKGRMLRSNWLQCTGLEGTLLYDEHLRQAGQRFRIVRDYRLTACLCRRGLCRVEVLSEAVRRMWDEAA
jgi:hypothetical protein